MDKLSFESISIDNAGRYFNDDINVDVLRLDKISDLVSGNKWFKLKYNIEEFLRQKKKIFVTMGGAYSNHILALAAAGKENGIKIIGIIRGEELNEHLSGATSKAKILALWDEATTEINRYWAQIPEEKFHDHILTFGQYEGTVWSSVFYFIDNEIHHRAQAYVYLRVLGIEPPFFWTR